MRLFWYSENPPKKRTRKSLFQDPEVLKLWDAQKPLVASKKVFPPRKIYVFCCEKIGTRPKPAFKKGVPVCVKSALLDSLPPKSVFVVYKWLYKISYYHPEWKMRVCEPSIGLLMKKTGYGHDTIDKCLSFLRKGWFIRRIWRGRPKRPNPRYLHSCYELPFDFDHIISWRIHHGRKRKPKSDC